MTTATATPDVEVFRPNPGPQEAFCRSSADEILYGGQAGGGKGFAQLLEALRYIHVPRYRAIIFRRTFPSLESSQIAESWRVCPGLGGEYNDQKKRWRFPSGAVLQFGHLEYTKSVYQHQSAEYAFIGFDELTEFEEGQYRFMVARLRTTARQADGRRVPTRIRAASNPGGEGHDWVRARWRAWIGEQPTAADREIRWYILDENEQDVEVPRGAPGARSRQFIRARLEDNPVLMERDPTYGERLDTLPLLVRMALRDGRWDLVVTGNVFRRAWLSRRQKHAPDGLQWVRYYDLAASLAETASRTATVAAAFGSDGTLYFRRGWAGRIEWPEQVDLIKRTMLAEPTTRHGIEAKMHGTSMVQALRRDLELAGIRFEGVGVDRDKLQRAQVWSPRAEDGQVVFVEEDDGTWIEPWIEEHVLFDGTGRTFDDRVDAGSGCVQMIGIAVTPAERVQPDPPKPALQAGRWGPGIQAGQWSSNRRR